MNNKIAQKMVLLAFIFIFVFGASIVSADWTRPIQMTTQSDNDFIAQNQNYQNNYNQYQPSNFQPIFSDNYQYQNINNVNQNTKKILKNANSADKSFSASTQANSNSATSKNQIIDNGGILTPNSNDNNLTALAINGSGGFLPSSVWQWLIVIILIAIIIVMIRLILRKSHHHEASAH